MFDNFKITYYDMGQGDCILIACPDDKLVMIDCGSSKGMTVEETHKVAVDIREYTKYNKNKIDALVLTHADKDHYNQVMNLLGATIFTPDGPGKRRAVHLDSITVEAVYFSERPAKVGPQKPLWHYTEAAVGSNIRNEEFKTKKIHKILINDDEQKRLTYDSSSGFDPNEEQEAKISNYQIEILSGKANKNVDWKIYIVAGGCKAPKQTEAIKANAISLATLLEIGAYKALFLGDATIQTEDFLGSRHRKRLSNVSFCHVPHHGSETSSSPAFVTMTNPKAAQITAQVAETGYCLPRYEQVKRWLDRVPASKQGPHFVDYWKVATNAEVNRELINWQINKKKKNYIRTSGTNDNKYYLQIDKIDPNFTGCFYLTHERMLFREKTSKNVWMTAASGQNEWLFPQEFK